MSAALPPESATIPLRAVRSLVRAGRPAATTGGAVAGDHPRIDDEAMGDPGILLVESALPVFDARIVVHTVVDADPTTTFAAARDLDFLTVRAPLVVSAMWLRGLPDRLRGTAPPPPPKLVLAQGVGLPGWLLLGERPDREIAFGAVGKFWQPTIEWRDVPRADFTGFAEPGWGKIAANFSVRPYGAGSSLLSYECRTGTTDPQSRRRFLRYWWLVRPFVGHILRATLATIKAHAEKAP